MDLIFEKFCRDHFADYFRMVSNPEVMAMITERAIPADEAQRDYQKVLADNAIHPNLGHFRVTDAKSGHLIGLGKLDVAAAESERAELGYILLPEYWGRGIGSRIADLLIRRARQEPTLRSLFAIIDPKNNRSRKILTNCGFFPRNSESLVTYPVRCSNLTGKISA